MENRTYDKFPLPLDTVIKTHDLNGKEERILSEGSGTHQGNKPH